MVSFNDTEKELFLNKNMKPCILIVDDSPDIFEILADVLQPEGFEVLWARNGEEFRQKVIARKPCLIMLDIGLGNENGPELYKRLLLQGLDRSIPVIFISGLIQSQSPPPIEPGRRYAMHPKPFEFDRLLTDIRTMTTPI